MEYHTPECQQSDPVHCLLQPLKRLVHHACPYQLRQRLLHMYPRRTFWPSFALPLEGSLCAPLADQEHSWIAVWCMSACFLKDGWAFFWKGGQQDIFVSKDQINKVQQGQRRTDGLNEKRLLPCLNPPFVPGRSSRLCPQTFSGCILQPQPRIRPKLSWASKMQIGEQICACSIKIRMDPRRSSVPLWRWKSTDCIWASLWTFLRHPGWSNSRQRIFLRPNRHPGQWS